MAAAGGGRVNKGASGRGTHHPLSHCGIPMHFRGMTTYTAPPTSFEELIAPFPTAVQEAAAALRAMARTHFPDAREHVSGGLKFATALYSFGRPTNVAFGMQPTPTHCKFFLHHVRPGDVAGLKLEGTGKHARHVKVASADAAERPELVEAMGRAGREARARAP